MSQLRVLLEDNTAGDPMGRRGVWTGLRLRQIAAQLKRLGLRVCPNTVRRLLKKMAYALHANRKSLSSAKTPERDRQFKYIASKRRRFASEHCPIISVDTKKRELVGNFKNPGQVWSREPTPVHDHDFPSLGEGVANLHGVYDPQANRGRMTVGTSRNTPAFGVESIRQWWLGDGRHRYPQARRFEVGTPEVLSTRNNAFYTSVDIQLIRVGAYQNAPITEVLRYRVKFKFLPNPDLTRNGRFPTAVAAFQVEPAAKT